MQRGITKQKPTNGKGERKDLTIFGELLNRMSLAVRMGTQTYGGDRNIMRALGYKEQLVYDDYMARYKRQEIAKAIIDRPVRATWQGDLELIESGAPKETTLEKEFRLLSTKLALKSRLARVDRLACIGRYGVLLLGLDDVSNEEGFKKPVASGKRKLVYVQPFGEGRAAIKEFEDKVTDPRYGLPRLYEVQTFDMQTQRELMLQVHHTRVIHVITDTLESEVIGTPVLESVFNRLMDIEKIVGGDAEMFWRGARPGYTGKVGTDFQLTDAELEKLRLQIDEFEHNLRRILINEGLELQSLAQQISDPRSHLDVQMQTICAVTGIPKRVLLGSERGELSSTQDQGEWLNYVQARRDEHAEPHILRPFIDRCIELQILPKPKGDSYDINWQDLFSLSEKERVEIGRARATALKEYSTNPAVEAVIPADAFLELCLGLTTPQLELIQSMRDKAMQEELLMIKDLETEENVISPTEEENED